MKGICNKSKIEEFNIHSENEFWEHINFIKENNNKIKETSRKNLNAYIETFGCQMNFHDSEKIEWMLKLMGYNITEDINKSDFIILNTCAIRENAEQRVYGRVGSLKSLKRQNKDLKIAVAGCMTQIKKYREHLQEKYPQVDIIFGTNNITELPELIYKNIISGELSVSISDKSNLDSESLMARRKYKFKGFVNIIYGCNNFCTYCIVPYTRGREISRNPESIIKEVKSLAKDGCKEIMLLGQNVNSYGKTLDKPITFTELLKEINSIEGIERIRFMSSHPKDISDELINSFSYLDKLSNHLHLPVQSGSNRILRLMNRSYTKESYLDSIKKIRRIRPDIAITTDIIVGFPGETDKDFKETLDLVKEVSFDAAYSFIYSSREGTKAASMDNHLEYSVKQERLSQLNELLNEIGYNKNLKFKGKIVEVLVEEVSKNNSEFLTGRTDEFKLVHFRAKENLIGKIVKVKIENVKTFSMEGILVE